MVLILTNYPVTKYSRYYLDIEYFKKKLKSNLEIYDLSLILNKQFNNHYSQQSQSYDVKKFSSLIKFYKKFKKLKKKNLILFNLIQDDSFKSLIIKFILKLSKVKIIRISSIGVSTYLDQGDNKNLKNTLYKLFFAIKNFNALFYYIRTKFFKFLSKLISADEISLISGNLMKKNLSPLKFINIHSLDYSKVILEEKNKLQNKLKRSDTIVFLDKPGPYFVDDFTFRNIHEKIKVKPYYENLNKFLRKLEKIFQAKIIIIPHPKAKGRLNPYYDKKFQVDNRVNAAIKLIKNSKLVISTSASTAISYAISYLKPILLLYSCDENKNLSRYKDKVYMSKILDIPLLKIEDNIFKNNSIRRINKKKFKNYKLRYLTSPEIQNKTNFEIISDFFYKNFKISL